MVENRQVTVFCAQLEHQTVYTAQRAASHADSSPLQSKVLKSAPVLVRTVRTQRRMPPAAAKPDLTSTPLKVSARVSQVPLQTAFQSYTACANKVRSEVQQAPVLGPPIVPRSAIQATERETLFQAFVNALTQPTPTRSATRIVEATHLSQRYPLLGLKLPWCKMELPSNLIYLLLVMFLVLRMPTAQEWSGLSR